MSVSAKISLLFVFVCMTGCKPILPEHIPYVPIDKTIYFTDFPNLMGVGGSAYVDGGSRGLIVYRVNLTQFNVYERHCPYFSETGCGTVSFDQSGLYLVDDDCFGEGCGSLYNIINGGVEQGPSIYPLVRYNCETDGNFYLRIYN